ncbi:hypothetical protein HK096_007819, partial [Nowakowskiella sp. JEL0078]
MDPLLLAEKTLVPKSRLSYIDRLRVFLTCSVIIHHTIYILSNGWWPVIPSPYSSNPVIGILSFIVLTFNQSYFMGGFFFLAGYFVPASYEKKRAGQFISSRALRLLVPIPFYELIIAPMIYQIWRALRNPADFAQVYRDYFGQYTPINNPLWFVVLLFVFDSLFLLLRLVPKIRDFLGSPRVFGDSVSVWKTIWIAASIWIALSVVVFAIRIVSPVGFWVPVLGMLAYFPQYLLAYIFGAIAWKFDILTRIPRNFKPFGFVISLLFFAIWMTFSIMFLSNFSMLLGGLNILSFCYCVLEMGFAIFFFWSLLTWFRDSFNKAPTKLESKIASAAYAAYIIHPLVVIPVVLILEIWNTLPIVWIVIGAPVSIVIAFTLGILLKLIPG